ncbi:MAG: hypothetical protein LBF57_00055, partial [Holosporaceae bacterium]|nr:hypothetical protein [Holosporaceae bacterium]
MKKIKFCMLCFAFFCDFVVCMRHPFLSFIPDQKRALAENSALDEKFEATAKELNIKPRDIFCYLKKIKMSKYSEEYLFPEGIENSKKYSFPEKINEAVQLLSLNAETPYLLFLSL